MSGDESFDYVVTGAGTAGCAVAARLSESGHRRVLLLEAGIKDNNPWIHVPMGYTKVFLNPDVNWMFESEPEPQLNGRTMFQPRGKVLGGTSSINGMIYIRGNHADYDDWRQHGCEGWDWDSVLPYFKKAEDQERGKDEYHGLGGPVAVSDRTEISALVRALHDAAIEAGISANRDLNGARQDGVGYYQSTTRNGWRASAATAYLRPARHRPNLVVRIKAHATRVLIESGRAVGVEYRTPDGLKVARAEAEVIVCGGTYGSPQLLQLSGLGPGDLLRDMGIPVLRDMPGVGSHLQDHFSTFCVYQCSQPLTINDLAISLPRRLIAGAQYALLRSGPLADNALSVGAFIRSDPRMDRPDLQINMSTFAARERTKTSIRPHPFSAFTLSPVHLCPEARGTVRIKNPDPLAPPAIRFNFLKSDYDRRAIVHGMRLCRTIAQQPALAPFVVKEVTPGFAVTTDLELIADLRARGISNMHPVGTCRMGRGTDAVVDPRLRVHCVAGLRVADASIMPRIVAGNTMAPATMIGEKAADMILQDGGAG